VSKTTTKQPGGGAKMAEIEMEGKDEDRGERLYSFTSYSSHHSLKNDGDW